MLQVRPLFMRVYMLRTDLDDTALIQAAVEEAIADVCQQTTLARSTQTYDFPAGTSTVDIWLPLEWGVLGVHRVRGLGADGWYDLTPVSKQQVVEYGLETGSSNTPEWFSHAHSSLTIYKTPASSFQVQAEVSYTPVMGLVLEEIDLPEAARAAVIAKAESLVLRIQGAGQDLVRAEASERRYERELGGLLSRAQWGHVGDAFISITKLAGVP